jgi:hypothetical protein
MDRVDITKLQTGDIVKVDAYKGLVKASKI